MEVIRVENLSKLYDLGQVGTGTISKDLNRWWANVRGKEDPYARIGQQNDRTKKAGKDESVWALKDINFSVNQGEVVGIIGRNGAGKSTLLKIISRITTPTTGTVKVKGRIASLLEVGTGFHPEMTGRENIFMNGTLLGMLRREIQSKLDEIIDFAGVEKYIDTPVKRYSSGMQVRLGFAVAAFLEPEILIVDEVLAVGDAEFQKKAIGRMQEVSRGDGRTILFVSHNMAAVKSLCTRGIVLGNGEVAFDGGTDEAVDLYLSKQNYNQTLKNDEIIKGDFCEISNTQIITNNDLIKNGEDLIIRTIFKTYKNRKYSIIMSVFRETMLAFVATSFYKEKPIIGAGEFEIEFIIPKYLLNPGFHSIDISIVDDTGNFQQYLYAKEIVSFNLIDDNFRRGNKYNKGWGGVISPILKINYINVHNEEIKESNK